MAGLEIDPQTLGLEFGGSAVIGGIIGFTAKKVAKIIAVIVGAQMALFKFLESQQYIEVRWEKFGTLFQGLADASTGSQPPSIIMSLLSTLSVSAGFSGGFLLGFKKG